MSGEQELTFVVGNRLLSHAAATEARPRYVRGRVTEMFPFIYEAAKKMGVRAISRWLNEEGLAISAPTISRALSKSDEHLEALVRSLEPHAKLLVDGYCLADFEFLFGPKIDPDGLGKFRQLLFEANDTRRTAGIDLTEDQIERRLVSEPCEKLLTQKWFVLSEETREYCRKFFTCINPDNQRKG